MKLKKIDLKKSDKTNHPDIKVGRTWYLAKVGNHWCVGTFSREWYGLNMNGDAGQFDAPGTNSSEWKELYEMVMK